MSHHSHEFSREAKPVECLTIRVHLVSERPKPARAPYLEAIVWQKHTSSKKPIQLNKNATEIQKYQLITSLTLNVNADCFFNFTKKRSEEHEVRSQHSIFCITINSIGINS